MLLFNSKAVLSKTTERAKLYNLWGYPGENREISKSRKYRLP